MPDQRISVRDRVRAIDALEALAWQLNAAAAWLGKAGCESESDQLDHASVLVLAACQLLSRPIRPRPVAEPWQQQQRQLPPG